MGGGTGPGVLAGRPGDRPRLGALPPRAPAARADPVLAVAGGLSEASGRPGVERPVVPAAALSFLTRRRSRFAGAGAAGSDPGGGHSGAGLTLHSGAGDRDPQPGAEPEGGAPPHVRARAARWTEPGAGAPLAPLAVGCRR